MKFTRTLAVAAAAALTLGACGGGDGGDENDPLTVAVVIPLTGASARTAEQMENAAKLAVSEINADGGVNGRDLEIKVYDDELTPELATKEAQRAITRDKAVAIIGAQSSGEALAIREVAERSKVPFITSSATSEAVTEDAKFTYRIAPLLTDYANGVVDTATALGLKDPVLMNDSGPAGLQLKDLFLAHAQEVGLEFAGSPVEYPINGTDVSAQVATASKQNPDGVLVGGSAGSDHGLIAKTMLEQGLDVPLIGFSPILVNDAIKIAGDAYSELPGVYSLQNLDQTKDGTKEFFAAYAEEFGEDKLTEHPAQTYDAFHVLADALKASDGEGGQKLADALDSMEPFEGVSGKAGAQIEFTADRHDGYQGDYLVTYKMNGPEAEQVDLAKE
ncbi:ABC transporter substrate-binding protein [Aeromicrobium sp. HA]|uniref:ABC transporter substrate-binding protein n=1 Tax=Aeromicrobium sp. HA TaxID=3009077 RepID=UPI0022AEFBAC|nr:ABC transporter substrate-binding protein [Aeromicrobium sp. HA]